MFYDAELAYINTKHPDFSKVPVCVLLASQFVPVLRIRRIRMVLGLPDPHPDPDSSIIKQK
jgi:hypothetical protein